ncbi:MAG: guanylate kinase [Candidatus Eisenbacteria bacterium]|nr:guanylate kinase [Candidatus Eisenbacteria bacterium]
MPGAGTPGRWREGCTVLDCNECPRLIEKPFPIVISGASGTGKTSVVERLLAADGRIVRGLTATTRSEREGEKNGVEYEFLSPEEFEQKKAAGYFVEHAKVYETWYGVPRKSITAPLKKGKWVVLNVDVQGGLTIKKAYPEAVLIFVLPPSMEALEKRLRGRGTDSEEEIQTRLATAAQEMSVAPRYEYVVINDEVKDCTNRLLAIIRAETSRTARGLVLPKSAEN